MPSPAFATQSARATVVPGKLQMASRLHNMPPRTIEDLAFDVKASYSAVVHVTHPNMLQGRHLVLVLGAMLAERGWTVSVAVSRACPGRAFLVETSVLSVPVVLDPSFKEMFEIARPSREYSRLLARLSPVLIGTPDQVANLVEYLCSAAAASFSAAGLDTPPWRSAAAVAATWTPELQRAEKLRVLCDASKDVAYSAKRSVLTQQLAGVVRAGIQSLSAF